MAKRLYDYWFVQFDFPDKNGQPYKSSGGEMVWNDDLHMDIPVNWNTCLLSDYVGGNNTGDWGYDEPAEGRKQKVRCVRGADIVKLNDLPIRYIKNSNTSKLLSAWDIVIEVSGGSPTQATGRSAFITPGVLKRNGGRLTCSNFCHAFSMKNYMDSAYFYFMWRKFYDNNNMFNYEGKTSGIKNFMTESFLANKWLNVPKDLIILFFGRIEILYKQIDNNIEEINVLTKQRDELLPLLMNGQVSVNYHLSEWIIGFLCHDMHIEYDKSIIEKDADEQNSYPSVRKPYSLTLFKHTGNPFFMFLLLFKLIVPVSHELPADLHDKICANFIQGFQGIGMHTCADVLFLQIRYGIGEICYDVRHAVLDGTDFFQQVAQLCYPAVCFLFGRIIGKPLTQGGSIGLFHIRCCLLGLSFAFHS